jgi:hypothetical protein
MNNRTILVLVWEGEWEWVAMKWLGMAWGENLILYLYARWGIRGRRRGLDGDKHVLAMYKWN